MSPNARSRSTGGVRPPVARLYSFTLGSELSWAELSWAELQQMQILKYATTEWGKNLTIRELRATSRCPLSRCSVKLWLCLGWGVDRHSFSSQAHTFWVKWAELSWAPNLADHLTPLVVVQHWAPVTFLHFDKSRVIWKFATATLIYLVFLAKLTTAGKWAAVSESEAAFFGAQMISLLGGGGDWKESDVESKSGIAFIGFEFS